jgi:hypothetical protein
MTLGFPDRGFCSEMNGISSQRRGAGPVKKVLKKDSFDGQVYCFSIGQINLQKILMLSFVQTCDPKNGGRRRFYSDESSRFNGPDTPPPFGQPQ